MKKIKILYLVSTLKKCGPIHILFGIIKGLDNKRFDIYMMCLSKEGSDSMIHLFRELEIQIISLNNSRGMGLFRNRHEVQKFVDANKIDITHSHGIRADMINARLNNTISFNTIHNFPGDDYVFRYGPLKGRLMAMFHRRSIGKINFPIACSRTLHDTFLSNYSLATQFIQNGINTKVFFPDKSLKLQLKKKLNLPVDKSVFIVSGALTTLKNPEIILKAFNQFKGSNLLLLFIGNGNLLETLSKDKTNTHIIFRGKVDHVYDYLRAGDYYISASLTEGLPNSVLEALASEIPCLLSNIEAHTEIVGKSYPYLFDPKDPADLVNKIHWVLKNDHNEISENLGKKVRQNFSAKAMSEKYQSFYLNSLNSAYN